MTTSAMVFLCLVSGGHAVFLGKPAATAVSSQVVAVGASKMQTKAASLPSPAHASAAHVSITPANIKAPDPLKAELKDAEEKVKSKIRELKVQTSLEKEKEQAAMQAQNMTNMLQKRADKLSKEAELAEEIAKEKYKRATKIEKLRNASDLKAQHFLSEEREIERVLNQTRQEEVSLESNVSRIEELIKEQAEASSAKQGTTRTMAYVTVLLPVQPANATGGTLQEITMPVVVQASQLSKASASSNAQVPNARANPASNEAFKKLLEENNRLKQEKAALERRLNQRKVANEKAKLKQKLKNRLALADRHMKLRKKMLRAHR